MRRNGMLLPIASLPSPYGIGGFSKEAYEFIDLLEETGQKLWQILPLGPTSYGDSPYQSFSTFAGNPYFIDLDTLVEKGWLTKEACEASDYGDNESYIDYGRIYNSRFVLLKQAFLNSDILSDEKFTEFCKANQHWLPDYALYMALKNQNDGKSWIEWEEEIRLRKPEAVEYYKKELEEECNFYEFLQYEFHEQWTKVKEYAHEKGIQIVGDVPIYVAFDSADTWANPELFQLDEKNLPLGVAGCPPDAFSATGQLWGNPLYNWAYHKKTGYDWWLKRIAYCFDLYDIVRIDHFRGFDEYYSIPYGDETAVNGHWEKGPGMDLFNTVKEKLGELDIIAEDLGFLTESVFQLLKDSGYPGMKVLQFAFDPSEDSDYLTYKYQRNCVVYTGTHDNDTTAGWFEKLSDGDKEVALRYMNSFYTPKEEQHWDLIALAMRSTADTCIIPVQDFLGLGSEARINMPSTLGDNWKWRMTKGAFSEELKEKIRRMTKLYGR
ncbi:4-alpha-glucanotransferase [Blautia stercoris]|uniref:4-alpha-glucanotransferase n=1 Tax=Blautia stercoris TaxID=871664 RepID=UPI00355B9C8D